MVPWIAWYGTPMPLMTQPSWRSVQPTLQDLTSTCQRKHLRQMLKPSILKQYETDPCCFWHVSNYGRIGWNRKRMLEVSWCYVYLMLRSPVPFLTTCPDRANRGGCSQSCRWKYDLYDMPFGQSERVSTVSSEEYSKMSAVDMCMIENIPDMIMALTLKSKGHMKSFTTFPTVANCYKAACDALTWKVQKRFCTIKMIWLTNSGEVAQRGLATGFYKTPKTNNSLELVVNSTIRWWSRRLIQQ